MDYIKPYVEKTLAETVELVKDICLSSDFFYNVEQKDQQWICRWLRFFNDNYSACMCAHTTIVEALLKESGTTKGVFVTQTHYEFDISCSLFAKLFKSKVFLEIKDYNNAVQLLTTAFILGKYSGMQIRSSFEAIKKLSNGINTTTLNDMFEHLFVKYETPKFLTNNITKLNWEEIDMLMFILQGNNIRNYEKLPMPISRKESYFLINKVDMAFDDDILKHSIAIAKLMMNVKNRSNDDDRIQLIAVSCNTFKRRIDVFLRDIDFWYDAFHLLLQSGYEERCDGLVECFIPNRDLLDYFEYMKYEADNNFSLKGRTLLSVERAMFELHEIGQYKNIDDLTKLSWTGDKIKEYKVELNGVEYLFKELTSGKELHLESETMLHCVFTYTMSCYENYCSIWSMQKVINGKLVRHLTIEIQDNKAEQIRGKRNSPPNGEDLKVIEKWIEMRNLSLSIPANIEEQEAA